jgi:thymidylate synthase (FAD)
MTYSIADHPPMDPLADGKSYLRLIDSMGNSLSVINDARQSFDDETTEWAEKEDKLLAYLMKHRHTSPLRGVTFKWKVKAPIFIARQWYKHTIASTYVDDQLGWNEKSFRYCKVDEKAEFYTPIDFRSQAKSNRQASGEPLLSREQSLATTVYSKGIEEARQAYEALMAMGVSKEQARGVMPACLYTSFIWTCSLQTLLHFIDLRIGEGAQNEIAAYGHELNRLAFSIAPEVFTAFKENNFSI